MAAPKKEAAAPEAPKAVVGNIGTPSTGKRKPTTEKLNGTTTKVTY